MEDLSIKLPLHVGPAVLDGVEFQTTGGSFHRFNRFLFKPAHCNSRLVRCGIVLLVNEVRVDSEKWLGPSSKIMKVALGHQSPLDAM